MEGQRSSAKRAKRQKQYAGIGAGVHTGAGSLQKGGDGALSLHGISLLRDYKALQQVNQMSLLYGPHSAPAPTAGSGWLAHWLVSQPAQTRARAQAQAKAQAKAQAQAQSKASHHTHISRSHLVRYHVERGQVLDDILLELLLLLGRVRVVEADNLRRGKGAREELMASAAPRSRRAHHTNARASPCSGARSSH